MTAARALVERIDTLAGSASARPWRATEPYGAIVTDGTSLNHMDEANRRAYGGGCIAESVARPDAEFVAALVNAWPEIRTALLALDARDRADDGARLSVRVGRPGLTRAQARERMFAGMADIDEGIQRLASIEDGPSERDEMVIGTLNSIRLVLDRLADLVGEGRPR